MTIVSYEGEQVSQPTLQRFAVQCRVEPKSLCDGRNVGRLPGVEELIGRSQENPVRAGFSPFTIEECVPDVARVAQTYRSSFGQVRHLPALRGIAKEHPKDLGRFRSKY